MFLKKSQVKSSQSLTKISQIKSSKIFGFWEKSQIKSSQIRKCKEKVKSSQIKLRCSKLVMSDRIIVGHSEETCLPLFYIIKSDKLSVRSFKFKSKSNQGVSIQFSNQIKSSQRVMIWTSNQIDLIWLDLILGHFKAICAPLQFYSIVSTHRNC